MSKDLSLLPTVIFINSNGVELVIRPIMPMLFELPLNVIYPVTLILWIFTIDLSDTPTIVPLFSKALLLSPSKYKSEYTSEFWIVNVELITYPQ